MTIRLRPHHLLCLLTYVGKGYSPAFTANYDVIAARIGRGEDMLIVAGPDDICAPLLDDAEAHCRRGSVVERDGLAAESVAELLGQPVETGCRLRLDTAMIAQMRLAFATSRMRAGCAGCEWSELCTAVADSGYAGARLHGDTGPGVA